MLKCEKRLMYMVQMEHENNLDLTYEKYGLTASIAASFIGKLMNKGIGRN